MLSNVLQCIVMQYCIVVECNVVYSKVLRVNTVCNKLQCGDMRKCASVCVCVFVCVYVRICIYIYRYIYIHMLICT